MMAARRVSLTDAAPDEQQLPSCSASSSTRLRFAVSRADNPHGDRLDHAPTGRRPVARSRGCSECPDSDLGSLACRAAANMGRCDRPGRRCLLPRARGRRGGGRAPHDAATLTRPARTCVRCAYVGSHGGGLLSSAAGNPRAPLDHSPGHRFRDLLRRARYSRRVLVLASRPALVTVSGARTVPSSRSTCETRDGAKRRRR